MPLPILPTLGRAASCTPEGCISLASCANPWPAAGPVPGFEEPAGLCELPAGGLALHEDSEGRLELRADLVRIFSSCELPGTTLAGLQAQLSALGAQSPQAFAAALLHCADVLLVATDAQAARGQAADIATELLVGAAHSVDATVGTTIAARLLERVLGLLGGPDGAAAPRSRCARHRAAELLWRLLATVPLEGPLEETHLGRAAEGALLRASRDRAPAVRHASALGLAVLGGAGAADALVGLAAGDPAPRVRAAALAQLQAAWAPGAGREHLARLAARALDAAAAVRCRLFATLAALPRLPEVGAAELLRAGLADASAAVRRECECALRAWAERLRWESGGGGAGGALLRLLERLDLQGGGAHEAAAEAALRHLLPRLEWGAAARESAGALLAGELEGEDAAEEASPEQAFLARVSLSFGGGAGVGAALDPTPALLRRALAALDRGQAFELRQLLLALLQSPPPESPTVCRSLLHVATAVLLRAAPESPLRGEADAPARPGARGSLDASGLCSFHAAVLLARRALGIAPGAGRAAERQAESHFSRAMLVILRVLGPPDAAGPAAPAAGAFDALGARLQPLAEDARRAAERAADLRARKQRLTGLRDHLGACRVQERLAEAEAQRRRVEAEAEGAARELGARVHRVLRIIEAVFSYSRADFSEDAEMSALLQSLLRPALLCCDMAPLGMGGVCWPSLQALAVRCIALHASMSAATSIQHWPFFASVLSRYVPMLLAPQRKGGNREATEAAIRHCVAFLSDTLLVYCSNLNGAGVCDDIRARVEVLPRVHELFTLVAPLLGVPSAQGLLGPSPRLRHFLADRACSILLFSGTSSGLALERTGGQTSLCAGEDWVLTWLLLEVFASRPASGGAAEQVEVAVLRGHLLRFFTSLARLSVSHLRILSKAAESLLSLDLWPLGEQVQGAAGQRWHALPFPRVLRFLARHLAGAASPEVPAEEVAACWLECLWRPLALACLDDTALASAPELHLPQLLLIVLTAAPEAAAPAPGAALLRFAPPALRPALAAEVAWVLDRVVELWGWNSACAGAEELPAPLLELRGRAAAAGAAARQPDGAEWPRVYGRAQERRAALRRRVARLGIDVPGLAAAAVGALRAAAAAGEGGGPRGRGPAAAAATRAGRPGAEAHWGAGGQGRRPAAWPGKREGGPSAAACAKRHRGPDRRGAPAGEAVHLRWEAADGGLGCPSRGGFTRGPVGVGPGSGFHF